MNGEPGQCLDNWADKHVEPPLLLKCESEYKLRLADRSACQNM